MPLVDIPDVGLVDFPDQMDEDAISSVIRDNIVPGVKSGKWKSFLEQPDTSVTETSPITSGVGIGTTSQTIAPRLPSEEPPQEGDIPGEIGTGEVTIPRFGKEGTITRGVSETLSGLGEFALNKPEELAMSVYPPTAPAIAARYIPEIGVQTAKDIVAAAKGDKQALGRALSIGAIVGGPVALAKARAKYLTEGPARVPIVPPEEIALGLTQATMGREVMPGIPKPFEKQGIVQTLAQPELQRTAEEGAGRIGADILAKLQAESDAELQAPVPLPQSLATVRNIPEERTPDASSIETPAEVHGDVRPQPVEGVREVPVEEGGAGVQPQAERGLPQEEAQAPVAPQVEPQAVEPTPSPKVEPASAPSPALTEGGEPNWDAYLQNQAQRYSEFASQTEGGRGLAAGVGNIEGRWREAAMYDLRDALKQGKTINEAAEIAKSKSKETINRHNARRPKDVNWARWNESTYSTIDNAVRDLKELERGEIDITGRKIETAPEAAGETAKPAETPSKLVPEDKGITREQKAFRATPEGQKAMASRASRIALLNQLNEAIRKVDPKEAYDRKLLETLPDSQIDSMRDSLIGDYNRLVAKPAPTGEPSVETPSQGQLLVRYGQSNRQLERQHQAFKDAGIPLRSRGAFTLGSKALAGVIPDTPEARALAKKMGMTIARNQPSYLKPTETPKGEIRPGAQPYDPSSGATGIRPGASVFVREDVIPAAQAAAKGLAESVQGLRNLLSPASAGPQARLGAGIIRERAAELAQKDAQMRAKFAEAHKAMGRLDKSATLDWLDGVETGKRGTIAGPLKTFADEARVELDKRLREIRGLGTGKLKHFIQDYFPHLWKDPKTGLDWILGIFGKRPLRGPATFLKHRTIPTTRDGVNAGLVPVSWNPMDILLAKLHEMDRYVMGQRIFQEFKDKGLAKFSRSDIPPEGYAKINDRIANVVQYRPTVTKSGAKGAPERILRGHWFVHEDAARVLNNYLSPGLQKFAWFKALRWIGNNMNMATLGLSGYHGTFTMIDAGTSKLSLGLEQASRGDPRAAITIPRGLVGTLAANQMEAFIKGSKILKEYTKPGSVGGEFPKIVDALVAGGGRVSMPEMFQNSTLKNFREAIGKGNIPGAVLRAPFAAIHAAAYPLMNVVVPRLKLGVFMDMAKAELERIPATATRDEVRARMGKIWDSVDNRMGEVVYDNLFWNKTLKDLSHLAIRSVGWNLGTMRELGGGMMDSTTILARLKRGDPLVTRRMAYLFALPFTVGLMGALYQKVRTGKGPETLEDYLFPRTGNTLAEGEPERVNFPSYLKDIGSVKRHPIQTGIHKLHPMWGTVAEMLQNKDYYGTEIIHPGDPLMDKIRDEAKFVAKAFTPYAASGATKRTQVEPGIEPAVESFFGIMPVPAELTRSPAENLSIELMRKHMPTGARTKADFERATKEREAIQQIKMGRITADEAVQKGLVTEERQSQVEKRAESTYLEYAIKRLSPGEAMRVLERATPEEISRVSEDVEAKINRSKRIEPDEKDRLLNVLERLKNKQ